MPELRTSAFLRLAPLVLILISSGCGVGVDSPWVVEGSNIVRTESRNVPAFDRIEVESAIDVVARVGPAPSLTLTGDDNLLPLVRTEVRNGALHVDVQRRFRSREGIRVSVTTPALKAVAAAGSSSVQVLDVRAPSFEAAVSGSADLEATGEVGRLETSVSGSGSLTMSGRADHVEASVSGSGDLDLYKLPVRTAQVGVSGSGNVTLYATERLQASVSGSGDVRYGGNPRTSTSTSGSGSVSRV